MVWLLNPDRAFPAEVETRAIAREIHEHTATLPIVSMHGHVNIATFVENRPFGDATELCVLPDHYVFRMLVSQGAPLESFLGASQSGASNRDLWRTFCENWYLFRGTPTRFWLEHTFVNVLGLTEEPSASSADRLFDQIGEMLAADDYRPNALFDQFGIEVLATTDAATAALDGHAALKGGPLGGRILPTFRPDSLLELDSAGWVNEIDLLGELSQTDTTRYDGFLAAIRARRLLFLARGGRATDHGVQVLDTTPLDPIEASRIFDRARLGRAVQAEVAAFGAHMLFEFARMSSEDGLTMQIHPGVLRNHDSAVAARFGADIGYDIPVAIEFTRAMRPLLETFGHHPNLRLVLFTTDETTYTRELAPLAGVYPAVRLGAPWWFLDSPEGMLRFRESATETAGFYNTTGFVDDTRAFMSIPARHDLSRRVDAGYLARLVAEHRITLDEAVETARDLAYTLPLAAYPVPSGAPEGRQE